MKNKLLALATTLLLLGGVQLVTALPASAAWADCPNGQFCIWDGPGATGNRLTLSYSGSGGQLVCNFLGGYWDNRDISVYNRLGSHRSVLFFSNACATNGSIQPVDVICAACNISYLPQSPAYRTFSTYAIGTAS